MSDNAVKPSVCFVALKGYAVLSGDPSVRHIGGAEVQQVLIARELVRRGFDICFVVLDHGQDDGIEIDGIRLFKAYRPNAGIRGLRFLHPRLTSLWSAMDRADGDVYYQRGAEAETGLVAHWCRRHRRKFVFGAASNANFQPTLPMLTCVTDRLLYRYGLRRVSGVVVQNECQRDLYRIGSGRTAFLVRSGSEEPSQGAASTDPNDGNGLRILWVGRLHPEKRPDWAVDLARDNPKHRFDIVGECNADSTYGREIIARMDSLPHVEYHGYVPHAAMCAFYRRASLLLCTSPEEGFPNVFIEGWSYGVPVLSSVDPDGVIGQQHLGRVSEGYGGLSAALADETCDQGYWRACGERAHAHWAKHHTMSVVGESFEQVIENVAAGKHALGPVPSTM